jgi:hypothetical protein
MTQDELERRLLAWGRAYGEERAHEWDEDASPTGFSPLARGLTYAPGTREAAAIRLASFDRAGRARRLAMGAAAGLVDVTGESARAVPSWACDPIRARQTSHRPTEAHYDARFTKQAEEVQTAWLALRRFNPLQAECLRLQYQVRGTTTAITQREKAEMASRNLRDGVSLKRYRDELRYAKTWMHARLTR